MQNNKQINAEEIHGDTYGIQAMKWYGWGSPVGLGLGLGFTFISAGLFLWLLHLANIIH